MRKKWLFVLLVLAPIIVYLGIALNKCDDYAVWRPTLLGGLEKYKKDHTGWPRSFSELRSFLDSPDTLAHMDPRFRPIDGNRAVMTLKDWAHLTPGRSTYVVELDSERTISCREQ